MEQSAEPNPTKFDLKNEDTPRTQDKTEQTQTRIDASQLSAIVQASDPLEDRASRKLDSEPESSEFRPVHVWRARQRHPT